MGSSERCRFFEVAFCWWILLGMTGFCGSQEQQPGMMSNSFVASSVQYPKRWIGPYEWTYVRVELPPWFSSLTVTVLSDVDIASVKMEKLLVMCFRGGGLPLPDVSDTSLNDFASEFDFNGSIGVIPNFHSLEQCLPFQKNVTVKLTNEQIPFGAWYIGYFNGLGPARTQSKMISRGRSHMFSILLGIEGCISPTMGGPYCNQTINPSSCGQFPAGMHSRSNLDVTMENTSRRLKHQIDAGDLLLTRQLQSTSSLSTESIPTCSSSFNTSCLGNGEVKIYSLDLLRHISMFKIMATEVKFNETSSVGGTINTNGISLMCYARYSAIPSRTMHDHLGDISRSPLVIQSPEIGRWYIAIQAVNQTKGNVAMQEANLNAKLCFSFDWQVHECPNGKAGPNCAWEKHILQRISKRNSELPFESYFLPLGERPIDSAEFYLEPLLSNNSIDGRSDVSWTYFLLDIPPGAGGSNLHIQLTSDRKLNFEVYSKFGGLPSLDDWDYYVNSTTSAGNDAMFLKSDESSKETINFYIVYPREGSWSLGVKHLTDSQYRFQNSMSISFERCPNQCSSHGRCDNNVDESGMTIYSFCHCDGDHGGFDCSRELVSHRGHIWQSIALIGSNGAAILPAFWALRQKAFAEWVVFTCSGISSGIYHACDVGTWCPLPFHVLQFLDFWLSFMAVVSTFIYLTTINETTKRAILTGFSILTALLAVNGPTRSINIIIVIMIGTLGLLLGWILEFSSSNRCTFFSPGCNLCVPDRWRNIRTWPINILNFLHRRFRWHFLVSGFIALTAAAVSWILESSANYWIWHSLWHVTMYTSSFFFLCSTSIRNQEPRELEYELTRQNSIPANESTEQC